MFTGRYALFLEVNQIRLSRYRVNRRSGTKGNAAVETLFRVK